MPSPPAHADVAVGTRVVLEEGTRRYGALLVGGAPARAVRLGPGGIALLEPGGFTLDGTAGRARLAEQLVGSGIAAYAPALRPPPPEVDAAQEVVVVVPAYERADGVARLLGALGRTYPVVVVDDASPDPRALRAACAEQGAEVLTLPGNLGPAGARNAGLRAARERGARLVLFADSDVVIEPAEVERLRAAFADPRVAVAAPRIAALDADGSALARYEAVASSLDRGPRSAYVAPGAAVAYVPSAVLLARVSALGDGFDESMPVGEDVDLVWRLHRGGWRIRYDARALARHEHRVQLLAWARRRSDYGESAAALARRHGDLVAPAVLAPLGLAQMSAAAWQHPVAALAAGGASIEIARRLAARLGDDADARRAAAALVALATWMNAEQAAGALLRHHWPLTVLALLGPVPVRRRVRRLLAVALVADTTAAWLRQRPDLDPATFAVLRRLDDLSYGFGVWRGAVRARSAKALAPAWRRG